MIAVIKRAMSAKVAVKWKANALSCGQTVARFINVVKRIIHISAVLASIFRVSGLQVKSSNGIRTES